MKVSRWKAVCSYDGTDFGGWQSQPDGSGIQDHIENRLSSLLNTPTRVIASGRTDAGVHAKGQVFHFDATWNDSPELLINALRGGLSEGIQITRLRPVPKQFHAQKSAIKKTYLYRIYLGYAPALESRYCWNTERIELNMDKMVEASRHWLGEHDFASFSANRGKEYESTVRILHSIEFKQKGPRLTIQFTGNGFLYKMVRSLTGGLIDVGRGRYEPIMMKTFLEHKKRTHHIVTAAAKGLCLEKVYYA